MHQWITDNHQTPHLVVNATLSGVIVPEQHVEDGRIILNVSYAATDRLDLTNQGVSFTGRFGGEPHTVRVAMEAVLGIYARETGEGLVFSTDEYSVEGEVMPAPPANKPANKPGLTLVKRDPPPLEK